MLKQLTAKLENIFEHDSNSVLEQSLFDARNQFTLTENLAHLENLSYVNSGEVTSQNIESLLTQISCYFEMSFLLQTANKKKFKTVNALLYGKKISHTESWPLISLPTIPLFTVYKTAAQPVLKNFSLQELDPEKKLTAYVLKISQTTTLLLVTEVADPWTKIKIETLQHTLMKINFNL